MLLDVCLVGFVAIVGSQLGAHLQQQTADDILLNFGLLLEHSCYNNNLNGLLDDSLAELLFVICFSTSYYTGCC